MSVWNLGKHLILPKLIEDGGPFSVFKAIFWFWELPETLGGFWLNRRKRATSPVLSSVATRGRQHIALRGLEGSGLQISQRWLTQD